jgi:tRNA(Arg) A34 adenosine deaminase TadA
MSFIVTSWLSDNERFVFWLLFIVSNFAIITNMNREHFIKSAIEKSRQSVKGGGFPAGAVLVKNGEIIASGASIGNILHDPTSHGEVATIREACQKLGENDLSETVLYTSLEPCAMCLSASMWASIPKIIYACSKDAVTEAFYGGIYSTESISKTFTKPLELIHEDSHQALALEVIKEWEKTYDKKD